MAIPDRTARFLRDQKLDPETKKEDRGIAIHRAVIDARFQIVDDLLELYPQCVDAPDTTGRKKGRTPLHNAAQQGRLMIAKSLIGKNADINAKTGYKYTALMLAIESGRDEMVNLLVKSGADLNAQTLAKSTKELSALHLAAQRQSPDMVLQLLVYGADAKIANADGDTPLHIAVRARRAPAAALLLFHGASEMAENRKGVSPRGLVDELPVEDQEKMNHIFKCATIGEDFLPLVPKFLKSDPPLKVAEALHWAVLQNMPGGINYLLHIDPYAVEAKNRRGWHALHQAAKFGHIGCVNALLGHGAEVNCVTKTGWTPLMLAAENGRREVVTTLLKHNASRTMETDGRETAAKIAMKSGHRAIALLLGVQHVASRADNAVEIDKQTAALSLEPKGLAPPETPPIARSPSPGPWGDGDVEGELYALTDAQHGDSSMPTPQNPSYIEDFLREMELTWYNHISWHPDDDDTSRNTNADGPSWSGPVKIAILDTGIDLEHPDFEKRAPRRTVKGRKMAGSEFLGEKTQRARIKACRNFVDDSDDVTDYVGHGTAIAGLIMSIAPRAELYIAKTSGDLNHPAGKDSKAPPQKRHSIQNAIRWAIDQQVDIINLSIGFDREGSYQLIKTLKEANDKGIIILAAAANHGNRRAIAWPARDRNLTICVTSGDEYLQLSKFAPASNGILPMFITHGENIWTHWPTNLGGGFRRMSGTSVSTPIAVGMTAMILGFLNQRNVWKPTDKLHWLGLAQEDELRTTGGMRRLLEYLCLDREGLKVLPPKLMWNNDPYLLPLQVLHTLKEALRNKA